MAQDYFWRLKIVTILGIYHCIVDRVPVVVSIISWIIATIGSATEPDLPARVSVLHHSWLIAVTSV
jgi:hypothetical protein